jgi:photosystem II stability/assembly factor-like uncharacterized protein
MKRYIKISLTLLITIIIVLGFAMPLNPPNGFWYQQFLPNIESRTIQDVFFLDSLTGWAVTNATNQANDTTFVLKTSNGGDNWVLQYKRMQTGGGFSGYFRVYFLNNNTGYTCDVKGVYKTSDGGNNWVSLNAPLNAYLDMRILSTDTIWLVSTNLLTGGVFFTSNGGASWQNQFSGGNQNPKKIYMYNARIGFMSNSSALPNIYKTTNGGVNWVVNVSGQYFFDMHFVDSLTGWYSYSNSMYKTTDGGVNWIMQRLPFGGNIISTGALDFSVLNKDTIWGVGGEIITPVTAEGILYRTTNGGDNWLFYMPDTTINLGVYRFIQFNNSRIGWAYHSGIKGIHTTNGGDTTFLVGIQQVSAEVPKQFKLFQNYPNPFNPVTTIKYALPNDVKVVVRIYDILGREVKVLVNELQKAGYYDTKFDGSNFASGVYFYRIEAGDFVLAKKMVLVK